MLSISILDGQGHLFPSPFQFWKDKDTQANKSKQKGHKSDDDDDEIISRRVDEIMSSLSNVKKLTSGRK